MLFMLCNKSNCICSSIQTIALNLLKLMQTSNILGNKQENINLVFMLLLISRASGEHKICPILLTCFQMVIVESFSPIQQQAMPLFLSGPMQETVQYDSLNASLRQKMLSCNVTCHECRSLLEEVNKTASFIIVFLFINQMPHGT